jgi:aquaporin Z
MNKYIVEFLGTLFLAFIVLTTGNYLAIGAALAIAILLGASISGGSYNPAVTVALFASGKLASGDIIPYIVAEIAGALAAFLLFRLIY